MRVISDTFIDNLKTGFLSELREKVVQDLDLDLHIREGYLNIYFKGNALLKLTERAQSKYKVDIHKKFLYGLQIPDLVDANTTRTFIDSIPKIKENIIKYGKSSLEIEYEQLIIRANNNEARNNSEYFIVDRQFIIGKDRIDLVGFFWDSTFRRSGQTVFPCIMEIKFALNSDINKVQDQLTRYFDAIQPMAENFSKDLQAAFRQRLELGIFHQSPERIAAMKTLEFSTNFQDFQFIIIFVDYNPRSSQLNLDAIEKLPFRDQIKIFHTGFAMWQQNLTGLSLE